MNTYENQFGTIVAPNPSYIDATKKNRLRRVNGMVEMILTPETVTELNRKVVKPPRTGLGIEIRAAANLEKTPIMKRKKQAA